jgi:hypothetical protein
MIRMLFFILMPFFSLATNAQSVKGAWYGRADVKVQGSTSNYLTEFILKQKGDEVEGIFGYYFKDTYQSFFIRGAYDVKTRQVSIHNLPLLFHGSSSRDGIECPMHFQGTLLVSKVRSTLKGLFYTDAKYKYTCPELTVNMTLDTSDHNQDSLLKNAVAVQRFWKPSAEDVVINAASEPKRDTLTSSFSSSSSVAEVQLKEDTNNALVEAFGKRNNIYEKDIIIYDDSVLVSFYDNGDVDDDTISVFLNKKPILVRRGLSARALNIYIGLDSSKDVNELSMFADNMGKFPPNTALMVISDRQKRYEFYLSASLKQNASVRLRKAKQR